MRIRRRAAAYQARLPQHELPVVFIAQANRFAQSAHPSAFNSVREHEPPLKILRKNSGSGSAQPQVDIRYANY
jgi:hypothetical protein